MEPVCKKQCREDDDAKPQNADAIPCRMISDGHGFKSASANGKENAVYYNGLPVITVCDSPPPARVKGSPMIAVQSDSLPPPSQQGSSSVVMAGSGFL